MGLEVMGDVNLTEPSLSDQSEGLISFGNDWPILFGQEAKLFVLAHPLLLLKLEDLVLLLYEGLVDSRQLLCQEISLEMINAAINGFLQCEVFVPECLECALAVIQNGLLHFGGHSVDLCHTFELPNDCGLHQ